VFDIVYKGQNLRPVEDALIDITREYVSEGIFKTIEKPITDIDGKTTASLIKDTGIYTFYVYKDGELLSTFQKVTPVCENDLTDDCQINLNAVSTTIQIDEFSTSDDMNYVVTWDEDTSEVELTFSIISGSSNTINLTSYLFDENINETICSSSVTSSSGSLTCSIPESYTNQTAVIQIFKDNNIVDIYYISLKPDSFDYFGYTGYFLAFIIIMIIPLMFITSLIGVVVGMMIGVVMLSLLLLTNGASIYSITGGIIWFMIAGIILLWKLNQTERR